MKTLFSSLVIGHWSLFGGLGSRIRCTMNAENGNALICRKWALKGFGQVLSAKTVSTPRCKAVQSVSVDSAEYSRWVNLFSLRILGILGIAGVVAGVVTCGALTTESTEYTELGLWLGALTCGAVTTLLNSNSLSEERARNWQRRNGMKSKGTDGTEPGRWNRIGNFTTIY